MSIGAHRAGWLAAANQGGSDPYFSQVSLLLHGDGNWVDATGKNTVYPVGSAAINTGTKKFGTGSMFFNGSGKARIVGTNTPVAANQDFTVEAWVYPTNNSITGLQCIATPRIGSGNWFFGIYQQKIFIYDEQMAVFQGGTVGVAGFQHMAYTRQGTTHRLFLNGALSGTKTSNAQAHPSIDLAIGSGDSSSNTIGDPFYGFIDDLRITVGTARYTEAFTPPDQPFPDK